VEGIRGDEVTELDRRGLLKAACIGCATLGLAACGGGGSSGSPAAAGSTAGQPSTDAAAPSAAAGGAVIAKLTDIPIGGSISARAPSGPKILLARPTATAVVAFSSVCTHQQCTVEPDGKRFACPCHGSTYDAFTGKNISGPAPSPLHPFAVKISGQDVVEA
jgi:cytochrome b6-f complex iron-sulfur subunit